MVNCCPITQFCFLFLNLILAQGSFTRPGYVLNLGNVKIKLFIKTYRIIFKKVIFIFTVVM